MDKRASGKCCVITSCKASRRKIANLRLFKFPKHDTLLKKWVQACDVDHVPIFETRNLVVCQRHFNPDQIGFRRLVKNAVPERYLDTPSQIKMKKSRNADFISEVNKNSNLEMHEKSYTYEGNDKILKKEYRKSGRRCIITSCRATYRCNPNLRFFSFPNPKTDRFKIWVEICKLTPTDLKVKNILICEKHFWKADLRGKRYTAEAQPKFFLSAPRYKIIGPSDPNFKVTDGILVKNKELAIENPKKLLNKCIIKTCGIISKDLSNMMIFPKDALNLFDVWSDIFKLYPSEIFNIDIDSIKKNDILYICQKHSLESNLCNNEIGKNSCYEKVIEEENGSLKEIKIENEKNDRLKLLQAVEIYKKIKIKDEERENFEFYKNLQTYYEEEVIKIKKEAEKEKIKYLSIISLLKEENIKLKEQISRLE